MAKHKGHAMHTLAMLEKARSGKRKGKRHKAGRKAGRRHGRR